MRSNRYIVTAIALAGLVLTAVAAFNAIVDPEALWSPVNGRIQRLEALNGGGRRFKSERIAEGDWQVLIFGSSRCLRAIDPKSGYFPAAHTFNACLSGTNMAELVPMIRFARKTNPNLRRIVIGLDFEMFSDVRGVSGDFDLSRPGGKSRIEMMLDYLLSLDTLRLSAQTLFENYKKQPNDLSDDGYADRTIDPPKGTPRARFDSVLKDDFLIDPDTYGAFRYSPARVAMFGKALKKLNNAGIRVDMFISPLHARQLDAIYDLGLGGDYAVWLGDMAMVAQDASIKLVDFSGFNDVTMEPVPPKGSHQEMKYYWESSHYKRATGDLILAKLAGSPEDFGVTLTPDKVASEIAVLHVNHIVYSEEQPAEVAAVAAMVRATAGKRKRLQKLMGKS
jgi:hypothetical protein